MDEKRISSQVRKRQSDTKERIPDILKIYKKEKLENFINKMMEVSDMLLFFIDYKGEIIVSGDAIYEYGSDKKYQFIFFKKCYDTLAIAATKAAIKNKPFLFYCPKKIVNLTIPIVIDGHYMGALAGGMIRCDEENAFPIFSQENENEDWKENEKHLKNIPILPYKKIMAWSELLFSFLEEMKEKEECRLQLLKKERYKKHLEEIRRNNILLKEDIEKKEQERLKAKLLPQLLLNFFVTASNYAVLENAVQTEEVIVDLSSVFRYYMDDSFEEIAVKQELEQIDKYLKTLQNQYDGRFHFIINCKEDAKWAKIPVLSIFPFVEYIINDGILPGHFKGKLYLDVELSNRYILVQIQLQSTDYILGGFNRRREMTIDDTFLIEQIRNTEKRLFHIYDGDCQVIIHPDMVKIEMPERIETRRNESD